LAGISWRPAAAPRDAAGGLPGVVAAQRQPEAAAALALPPVAAARNEPPVAAAPGGPQGAAAPRERLGAARSAELRQQAVLAAQGVADSAGQMAAVPFAAAARPASSRFVDAPVAEAAATADS
jgi:hypothetical protein